MKITIEIIEHEQQRYPTVGDWQFDPLTGDLSVRVSNLGNDLMETCVGLHEVVEALVCRQMGIAEEDVDVFDKLYSGDGEPGDDPDCPYRYPHFLATNIERLMADALQLDWGEYDAVTNSL